MKKAFLLILLSLSLIVCGCGGTAPSTNTEKPTRVAVLFSSLAEIWLEAGGEIAITVGETVERGFADADTPLVDSGAGKTINVELLLSLDPDLVICSADIAAQAEAAELLREAGIETLVLHVETFDDYIAALTAMTEITGNTNALQNALAMKSRIDDLLSSERVAALVGTRILFVRAGSTAASTKAKGSADHFAADMLRQIGCVNLADNAPLSLDNIGMEAILASDPDHIFFSMMGDEAAARSNIETLLKSETWQALTAVREGRVTILDKSLFHFKPCGRWEQAYLALVDCLLK